MVTILRISYTVKQFVGLLVFVCIASQTLSVSVAEKAYTILSLFPKAEYFRSIRQDPLANTKTVFLK